MKAAPAFEAIWFEGATCDRGLDGASRFMGMGTVATPAERGQLGDVSKQRVYYVGDVANIERSDPGVSITHLPPGMACRNRAVVV